MQRFLDLFGKGSKKEDKSYNCRDPKHFDVEKGIYRYYNFDSDELKSGVGPNQTGNKKSPEQSVSSMELSNSSSCSLEKDLPCVDPNFSESGSLVTVLDNFSSSEQQQKPEAMNEKNFKKNTFVININNGKYFHIGSQKTININNGSVRNRDAKLNDDVPSSQIKTDFQKLLDSDEKLTEIHMTLISLHVNDRWKELVRNLGLDESFLEVLELRNDHNRTLTVYDALQKHVNLFPNTSLGFVVNVLLEIQNVTLVEKLALELKSDLVCN